MKEGKYIHYCWFGGKPLPRLAHKCLASWKKFLPDYEIICWNEKNSDLEECEFVKKAYKAKQYAFVADYIRTKAMYEMGGIYFDTDMEITKDPKELIKQCDSFLGVEDSGKVCCGVWYEKYPKSPLATKLLKKYQSLQGLNFKKRNEFTIPLLITDILEPWGFDYKKRDVQVLKHNITIFPRDYFYPYSYNRTNNLFTDNTCMIHYYDASWLPVKNRIENFLVRRYGREQAIKMIKAYQRSYVSIRKIARILLFPIAIYKSNQRKKAKRPNDYLQQVNNMIREIENNNGAPYLVLYNGEWFGITSATKELFRHTIDCRELHRKKDINEVAEKIVASGVKQVIFSAMSEGGPLLIKRIHKLSPQLRIKVYWHGSLSQVRDLYGWKMHKQIMDLCRRGYIVAFATCKKSLYDFYKNQNIPVYFITNKVKTVNVVNKNKNKNIKVGLYAASSGNWRKNMFSQIAAVALIKDAVLDIVPLDPIAEKFAQLVGVNVTGASGNLSRKELMQRMSGNDVNLYVTFSECAPMLPLESMELGAPCLTGNNHHYFKGLLLEKYLVINQETNIKKIKEKILNSIKNREKIIELYNEFSRENLKAARQDIKNFLEDKNERF